MDIHKLNHNVSYHRNSRIDFLRGIAILSVLILHFHLSYHLEQSALNQIFSRDFIIALVRNGNYGVTMFFVISGFLITSTSLERYGNLSNIDISNFYVFRLARIIPCLLLVLFMIMFFNWMNISIFKNDSGTTSMFLAIFSVLTFWHNILMSQIGYFNYCLNVFWSLSVEEVFYIAFPLLCVSFKKNRWIIFCWMALIIIAPIFRSHYVDNEIIALYGYFSCFDAIAIGCCSAFIIRKIRTNGRFFDWLQYFSAAFLMVVYLFSSIMQNIVMGVSLVAICTAVLIMEIPKKEPTNYFNKMIGWFGKNSYELYLFHIIVLALMKEIYTPEMLRNYAKLCWLALFLMLSALVSGIISNYYSQPMNKKIRDFFAKKEIKFKNIVIS